MQWFLCRWDLRVWKVLVSLPPPLMLASDGTSWSLSISTELISRQASCLLSSVKAGHHLARGCVGTVQVTCTLI